MKQYLLFVPFSLKSVILYHQIKESENMMRFEIMGWLDNNSYLWAKEYDGLFIKQPYYSPKAKIILCSDNDDTNKVIVNQYIELGYSHNDFIACEELAKESKISIFQSAKMIDLVKYMNLKSAVLSVDYAHKIKLMKMRRWADLIKAGIIDEQAVDYDDFGYYGSGWRKKEAFYDSKGEAHIMLYTLDIGITDKCSLKCKHCANMMQYYKNPKDKSADKIIQDYKRLINIVDWIDDIAIIGGEPFVCDGLYRIVSEITSYENTQKKVGIVRIITNGTVVPSDEVCKLLADRNVLVTISNYKEKSRNLDASIEKYLMYGVQYLVLDMPNWRTICQLVDRDKALTDEALLQIRKSCSTRCRTIGNGKFYLCSFMKAAHELNAVPLYPDAYVDIYNHNAKVLMANYLDTNNAMPQACSWCSGDPLVEECKDMDIPAAEQVNFPLSYRKF